MSNVFGLLFIITIGFLAWGLISPKSLAKHSKRPINRVQYGTGFGIIAIILLIAVGVTGPKSSTPKNTTLNLTNTSQSSTLKTTPKKVNTVTTQQVTATQPISFITTNQNDSNLAKGQTKVAQAGSDGAETLTYKVTYDNGAQTSKTLISTVVTTQPVNQIVDVGTYVAPAVSTPTPTAPVPTSSSPSTTCYPLTDGGNCYEPGEYCRDSDQGASGLAGDGESITCEDNDGWRWEAN